MKAAERLLRRELSESRTGSLTSEGGGGEEGVGVDGAELGEALEKVAQSADGAAAGEHSKRWVLY